MEKKDFFRESLENGSNNGIMKNKKNPKKCILREIIPKIFPTIRKYGSS